MVGELEARERMTRCDDYREAYFIVNRKTAEITYAGGSPGYIVNGTRRSAKEVEEMTATLRRRAAEGRDTVARMQRVASELGAGWEFKEHYGRDREPVVQKGFATVYMNGRGYKAIFANGHTTATDSGASPRQAVANMINAVELALRKIRLHLDEVKAP